MLHKFYKSFRSLHALVNISKNHKMNQNKCYFRYIKNEDIINISFLHKVKDTLRQFNLNRKSSENLQTLCIRIAANVQKICNKKSKKKSTDSESDIVVTICDNKLNPISEDSTCLNLFNYKKPLVLKISEHLYDIELNAPWVISFNLPKAIIIGFPVYPENLNTLYTDQQLSIFNWYKGKVYNDKGKEISDSHIQWQFIVKSFYYTPTTDDIGFKLKCEFIPVNSTAVGPAVEDVSKNMVEAGPGPCPFEIRQLFTTQKLEGNSFRCVSYNILADLYCDSEHTRTILYPYCPPYALHIDYRKQLILKELQGYNADIICLQEVDRKIFNSSLMSFLACDGLKGLFYKKGKLVAEGLACFYRETRFKLLGDNQILLAEALKSEACLNNIWDTIRYNEPLVARVLDRSSVASATFLQSIENPNEILLVGNTHLYFYPDADHIRLIQGGIVIYWLSDLQKKLTQKYPGKRISMILCGDFNSTPSCGIYQLFTTGSAPDKLPDWSSNANEAVKGLSLAQNVPLDSACGTPQYTNFTEGFADCLDYIFYEKSKLVVKQVIPFPSNEELKAHTALPSIVFPSDHIAVISDLEFK
ncbi:2',5'-phosphodiesterase 12 [Maniola hyperantus]|uniref:2',5'-phosphodiesterase 12 n=1 Tax=Aphantopus hyperantus TaxID=2795564 RepID=UPI00156A5655|nr:2',5'-phosphodiesterase 12 [Maniola hyperantus]